MAGAILRLGTNLISAALNGDGKVTIMPWDWALKFTLTIATLAAGYQGGEVTPLFSIGTSLGVVLAGILGMPVEPCAALGYAAVFGSATNTLLAPILTGCEVFGFSICRRSLLSASWPTCSTWISRSMRCRSTAAPDKQGVCHQKTRTTGQARRARHPIRD